MPTRQKKARRKNPKPVKRRVQICQFDRGHQGRVRHMDVRTMMVRTRTVMLALPFGPGEVKPYTYEYVRWCGRDWLVRNSDIGTLGYHPGTSKRLDLPGPPTLPSWCDSSELRNGRRIPEES